MLKEELIYELCRNRVVRINSLVKQITETEGFTLVIFTPKDERIQIENPFIVIDGHHI